MSCILAIDPGTSKCGFALVAAAENGKHVVLWKGVYLTSDLEAAIDDAIHIHEYDQVIVGCGTGSEPLLDRIIAAIAPKEPFFVDEHGTTLEARTLYWLSNPPKGWRKIVPLSLQVPPEPYDDFVAVLLADRELSRMEEMILNNNMDETDDTTS